MNIPDLVNFLSPSKNSPTLMQNTAQGEDDDSVTDTAETTPAPTTTRTPVASTDSVSEEFDTFLQLLTAQIRNQDPLAPLDSTQFVEQLATFSQLELQATTNNKLDEITRLLAQQGYANSGA